MKVKVKEFNPNGYISRGVFEQVRWEKNIAMQQLEELGVPFGAKVELYAKPITNALWFDVGGRVICNNCGCHPLYDYFGRTTLSSFCPYCGAKMSKEEKNELSF